ncbi:hypothetical protein BH11PAT4_BH11PAT4_6550 [soil metagenome]
MKATVSQDFKTIYQISRKVYQEQPLLKRYALRQLKIDVISLLCLLVALAGAGIVATFVQSDLARNITFGVAGVAFFYVLTLVSRLNYSRMLLTADAALRGEQLTHGEVEQLLTKRRSLVAQWVAIDLAVFAAISTVQNYVDEKIPFLGTIFAIIGSATWQTVSFFSHPIIVLHGEAPLSSVKQSASAVKETWKSGKLRYGTGGLLQAALGYLALSIIFVVGLSIVVGGVVFAVSSFSDMLVLSDTVKRLLLIGGAILAVPLIAYLSYIGNVIQAHYAVWHTALYRFAVHKDYVGIFPQELLEKGVVHVEKRGLFRRKTA